MGVRVLHSADWHLDSSFASFPEEQRRFLRMAQRQLPDWVAELCGRENCDLVLLAGDLFDGKPSPDTVERVRAALKKCAVPVLIAPGNHDFWSPDSPYRGRWPENVHIFREPEAVVLKELDCRIYGAGYESMDCPPLLEGFRAEGEEKYCLMVLHGDPAAGNSPCCAVTAAQVRESGLDYLALGHIHKAGSFRAGESLCGWPGCPMGRGWDETGEKGVYIVSLDGRTEIRQESLDLPCFWEERAESLAALQDALPVTPSRDFFRVTLTGFGTEEIPAFPHLPYLTLLDEREDPALLWESAGEDTLGGMYFRLLRERAEEDPRAALVARLSRQILQGREVILP